MAALDDLLDRMKKDLQDSKDLTDGLNGDPLPEPPQTDVREKLERAKEDADTILDPDERPNIPTTPTPVLISLPFPLGWTVGIAQLLTWADNAVTANDNQQWQDVADAVGSVQDGWQAVYDLT